MLDSEGLDDVRAHLGHRQPCRRVFVEQLLEIEPAAERLDDLRVAMNRQI
jgi:hypothetical protein